MNYKLNLIARQKKYSRIIFCVLLLIYAISSILVTQVANSADEFTCFAGVVRISSFAGVLSSIGNICIITIVVFYKKPGFILSLTLLLLRFPFLFMEYFVNHSLSGLPGVFNNIFTIIAIALIYRGNKMIEKYQKDELNYLKEQHEMSRRLFEQTATALVNAIDAKDKYSHGHSKRVAIYSREIAKMYGKSEEECRKIYYAALLHDVGKIGIPDTIINKKGKLTKEEYEHIKNHSVFGNQILSSITEYPYLSIGAHFHHERYDGKGYPDGLKGNDIPEIARIISVADAYDAMTSDRSYRSASPQQIVREEIVKGMGTQFDPVFAEIMQHLIDQDTDYQMKETGSVDELAGKNELVCTDYRDDISEGIIVTDHITHIRLTSSPLEEDRAFGRGPAIILFDSLDERFHDDEETIRELLYYEYCEIWLSGRAEGSGVRKLNTAIKASDQSGSDNSASDQKGSDHKTSDNKASDSKASDSKASDNKAYDRRKSDNKVRYDISAVKCKDHVLINIDNGKEIFSVTAALPDSSRFVYIGLTGENCHISDVSIDKEKKPVANGFIPRIAEKISFIDGPEGDIPNVQIDNQRTESSNAILLRHELNMIFHTMSLPTARLVWHCPYFVIYSSHDGTIGGKDYKEYALIRLDGESDAPTEMAENRLTVTRLDSFESWDSWKAENKKGFDCCVHFSRKGNTITMTTENFGIFISNTTTIFDAPANIYVAITGDQCAITNIRLDRS